MKNKNIYDTFSEFIKKYKKYFYDNFTKWYAYLEKVEKYIDTNNKKPSISDKNPCIKQIGSWLRQQIRNYKNKEDIMKNKNIYDKFSEFKQKYKKYFEDHSTLWHMNLKKVEEYIDTNNKKPSILNKNPYVYKITMWLYAQINNYKKIQNIMKNQNIYDRFTVFLNDERYKTYFKKVVEVKNVDINNKTEKKSGQNEIDKTPQKIIKTPKKIVRTTVERKKDICKVVRRKIDPTVRSNANIVF